MNAIYFFLIPVVNAFNFSAVLIIPLIASILALILNVLRPRDALSNPFQVNKVDALYFLFISSIFISIVVNIFDLQLVNFNHTIALLTGFIFFYLGAERIAQYMSIRSILHVLYLSYLVTLVFGVIEFFLVNFVGMDISGFVYRPTVLDYVPEFLGIGLIRNRSFFEESVYYAGYLGVMMPILSYYLWYEQESKFHRILFVLLSIASCFMAFSVSFFLFFPAGICFTFICKNIFDKKITKTMVFMYGLIFCILIIILSSPTLQQLMFFNKLEGDSLTDRSVKLSLTLQAMSEAGIWNTLFGYGPGSYFNLGILPGVSVYLNYWRDLGFFGVVTYTIYAIVFLVELFRIKTPFGTALFVSALMTQLFFLTSSIYYYPHYFLPMVFYKLIIKQKEN